MTDVSGDQPQSMEAAPGVRVLAQFIRDFSFENPRAPASLRVEGKPEIDMGVEMSARGRQDGLFEVDLKITVNATYESATLFVIELVYGGVFQIAGVPEEQMEPVLLIECPRFLFPFARRIVGDVTADGGFFPPFLIEPLDFAAVYMARKQQEAAGAGQIGHA